MSTISSWTCMTCPERGEGEASDKSAEKHTKASGHSTATSTRPEAR